MGFKMQHFMWRIRAQLGLTTFQEDLDQFSRWYAWSHATKMGKRYYRLHGFRS